MKQDIDSIEGVYPDTYTQQQSKIKNNIWGSRSYRKQVTQGKGNNKYIFIKILSEQFKICVKKSID